jgi:hypothetical protein
MLFRAIDEPLGLDTEYGRVFTGKLVRLMSPCSCLLIRSCYHISKQIFFGKVVTYEITSAQKLKSRKSLAPTFSLILFLALC